jgi:broad specificity phosphatase PhoE
VLPATRLLLIRHAEVEARYQGVFGGRIDMGLSPLSAIYSSPMKRVQQTLAPMLVNGAPKPVILADLREVDFGDWTGLAWEDVDTKFGISAFAWLEQLACDGIANAECAETLQDRVEPCLRPAGGDFLPWRHYPRLAVNSASLASRADGRV